MKFAVLIISIFIISLIYGTLTESYNGTDFANRLVYKSFWFIGIQFFMFLSILMATLIRLPIKKRLYGFYTIHSGLLILFIGSFVTYFSGIDGIMQIEPNLPTNRILLNEDVVEIEKNGNTTVFQLPYTADKAILNKSLNEVQLVDFYPYAEKVVEWNKSKSDSQSGKYLLYNSDKGISQEIILSLDRLSTFKSSYQLGPLRIHLMPDKLSKCFKIKSNSGFIIWNALTNDCFNSEERGIQTLKTKNGENFLPFKYKGEWIGFIPKKSPIAIDKDSRKRGDVPYRIFDRRKFEKSPNLFIFGKEVSYFKNKRWRVVKFKSQIAKLPWMGLNLRLLDFKSGFYPLNKIEYTRPVQSNNELIKGNLKAIKIRVNKKEYWVTNETPLKINTKNDEIKIYLSNKTIYMPYQINLDKFIIKTNPGTTSASSYESYVSLLDGRDNISFSHKIKMNNPLKYDNFTFYQSSYYKLDKDNYGSVLSVNFDPGRLLKYLGSLLLVLGTIWHYFIRRNGQRRKK